MDRKRLFDEDPAKYELRRPNYPDAVFRDILAYSGASAGSHALEVGPGTGQATGPFLQAGLNVTAVELGTALAAYTIRKYADFPGLRMVNLPFEEFRCPPGSFDLFYSATAFHWIPADAGYARAFELVKPGGAIALFWNRPAPGQPDHPLFRRIQDIYDALVPHMSLKGKPEDREAVYSEIDSHLANGGFTAVERRLYHATREFNAANYVELLDTYSDHKALDEETRLRLYGGIREAIECAGGKIEIHDTVDLHLGRKA